MEHGTSKEESHGDQKQDLSTILSSEECVQLTLLIAHILEIMRKKQQQVFQVTGANTEVPISGLAAKTVEDDDARRLREKREKELSAPKMLELKKDSLDFFDKWRETVSQT